MATISTNEFKSGTKIILDNEPFNIIENEYVKPGKGQAFNRVKLRNLKTGRIFERTFKSGDTLEVADAVDMELQYLYTDIDGRSWNFMSITTFEQFSIKKEIIGDNSKWLKKQDICIVTFWNGTPIGIIPPTFTTLKVIEADPGIRGDTATGGGKSVTLETGVVIRAPLFINVGDYIKVDTRTGDYISRGK